MRAEETLELEVRGIRKEAETVRSFELWPLPGDSCTLNELPPFEAGAHLDVHIADGVVRQYSLTNPHERHRYVIGVNRDAAGRGGSIQMHEKVTVGSRLKVSLPRNHFPLNESATHSVLIAGGIGITPLLAMARRLCMLGQRWDMYYCARTENRAAFLGELRELVKTYPQGTLHCIFDGEPGVQPIDLRAVQQKHGTEADFYCCGPGPLMDAFTAALAEVPSKNVHLEYFKAPEPDAGAATAASFTVTLARQQKSFLIPPDRSILEVLLESGVSVMCSCREGICGTCETAVLSGEPDHRDRVLSPDERASNQTMMICVSRCKGDALTLDV